ncbi:AI-2E family transporter [Rhodocaloribacter litoris]|uniref:AI-2E family transporter n=1 Tax=Rhodocaloribacter litoris TaxID=2558931 RepID=UPI001E34236B|nr:AI-2E family transporter [Rhodocaloribacter litoris]QXD15645.1 AI-2E family transporter [Rhodocaloribacter litoris]
MLSYSAQGRRDGEPVEAAGSPDPVRGDTQERRVEPPDLTLLTRRLHGPLGVVAVSTLGLFTLAFFYACYAAQPVFMSLVIALLLNFLLSPAVAALRRLGCPEPVGAAVMMLLLLGLTVTGVYHLADPASEWVERAPERLRRAEERLRALHASMARLEEATASVEQLAQGGSARASAEQVPVAGTPLLQTIMSQTFQGLVGGVVLFFLTYFLLAGGDRFLRRLVATLPQLRHKRNAVVIIRRIEHELSRYFLLVTLINAGLGGAVALALYLLGMPHPVLWGVLAGVLNYVPYLGGLVGILVIGLVALISFDTLGEALAPPLAYLLLNTLEAYAITPAIMGQRLRLNPVAILVSIIFWGWIWGVAGAILAVPLLVSIKIVCDNVRVLSAVGAFLGR